MRLTVRDVAVMLNVSEKSIYRWIKNNDIPAYRVKDQYRFSKAEILEWASARKMPVPEAAFKVFDEDDAALPNVSDAMEAGGIYYRLEGETKEEVLKSAVKILRFPDDIDRETLYQILLARESMGSTGIGDGIAIPHPRNPIVLNTSSPSISLCFLERPIDFGAVDGKPVEVLFIIISSTVREHLHLLSKLAFALHDAKFKEAVLKKSTREVILKVLHDFEDKLVIG